MLSALIVYFLQDFHIFMTCNSVNWLGATIKSTWMWDRVVICYFGSVTVKLVLFIMPATQERALSITPCLTVCPSVCLVHAHNSKRENHRMFKYSRQVSHVAYRRQKEIGLWSDTITQSITRISENKLSTSTEHSTLSIYDDFEYSSLTYVTTFKAYGL